MWSWFRNSAIAGGLLGAALALPACAGTTTAQAQIFDGRPVVQRHDRLRAATDAGAALVQKGGCPVCTW